MKKIFITILFRFLLPSSLIVLMLYNLDTVSQLLKIFFEGMRNIFLTYIEQPVILLSFVAIVCILLFMVVHFVNLILMRFKAEELKPKNTLSKGDALWSTRKDMQKNFIHANREELLITGFLISRERVKVLTLFGKLKIRIPFSSKPWVVPVANKKEELKNERKRYNA